MGNRRRRRGRSAAQTSNVARTISDNYNRDRSTLPSQRTGSNSGRTIRPASGARTQANPLGLQGAIGQMAVQRGVPNLAPVIGTTPVVSSPAGSPVAPQRGAISSSPAAGNNGPGPDHVDMRQGGNTGYQSMSSNPATRQAQVRAHSGIAMRKGAAASGIGMSPRAQEHATNRGRSMAGPQLSEPTVSLPGGRLLTNRSTSAQPTQTPRTSSGPGQAGSENNGTPSAPRGTSASGNGFASRVQHSMTAAPAMRGLSAAGTRQAAAQKASKAPARVSASKLRGSGETPAQRQARANRTSSNRMVRKAQQRIDRKAGRR